MQAQFNRLKARRGPKKPVVAVAAFDLTAAFHMLRDGMEYRDLGYDYFVRADRSKTIGRLVGRLESLGYEVEVRAAAG